MNKNNPKQPDIKKRVGFLSIAGWFQDDEYKHTKFEICRSFKEKDGSYKRYKVRLNFDELMDLLNIIDKVLVENYGRLNDDEYLANEHEKSVRFYQ